MGEAKQFNASLHDRWRSCTSCRGPGDCPGGGVSAGTGGDCGTSTGGDAGGTSGAVGGFGTSVGAGGRLGVFARIEMTWLLWIECWQTNVGAKVRFRALLSDPHERPCNRPVFAGGGSLSRTADTTAMGHNSTFARRWPRMFGLTLQVKATSIATEPFGPQGA
jgi:hypothetical protein